MPALDLQQGPHSLSRYDVVGMHADRQLRFVRHVGLHDADNRSVEVDDDVSAVHMGPPLEHGKAIKAHVAGHVPLTNDEIKQISAWIEEIADEYHASGANAIRQYVIDPPWKDEVDPNTGVRRYRRYSCAGFVLDGHLQVHIELLKIGEDALPEVDRDTVTSAYPVAREHPQLLPQYGLRGNGPWKIVLAGYVLHALDRPTEQIRQEPYQVQSGDEQFPRKGGEGREVTYV